MVARHSRPTELARVAARASASGSTAVHFVVAHERTDTPPFKVGATRVFSQMSIDALAAAQEQTTPTEYGLKPEEIPGQPVTERVSEQEHEADGAAQHAEDGPRLREILYSAVGGVGMYVATTRTTAHRVRTPHVLIHPEAQTGNRLTYFKGRAVLNPGFLYEDGRPVEVLITMDDGPWRPSLPEARLLTTVVRRIANAAAEAAKAPILFMQYPAASFNLAPDGDLQNRLRRPLSPCVRMSVAIDDESPQRRQEFFKEVSRLAKDYRLALHVGDRSAGKVRGEWRPVRPHGDQTYRDLLAENYGPPGAAAFGLPVTIVGPARVGSTSALMTELEAHGLPLLGISVSALQEVAFINLLVAAPYAIGAESLSPIGYGVTHGLQRLVELTRRSQVRDGGTPEINIGERAAGYRMLIGTAQPISHDTERADDREYPLWVIWDVPEKILPNAVLLALDEAADRVEQGPVPGLRRRYDYARVRLLDTDRFRGRAKISVWMPHATRPELRDRLGDVAQQIEDEARRRLAEKYRNLDSIRLRVEWRERWLGRGNPPI